MSKADLYRLIDELPEDKEAEARRLLEDLRDACEYSLDTAPFDDEPLTDEDRLGLEEARAELARGEGVTDHVAQQQLGQ